MQLGWHQRVKGDGDDDDLTPESGDYGMEIELSIVDSPNKQNVSQGVK